MRFILQLNQSETKPVETPHLSNLDRGGVIRHHHADVSVAHFF